MTILPSLRRSEYSVSFRKLGSQLQTTVQGGAVFLKSSHRKGNFLKVSEPYPFKIIEVLSIDTTFIQIHLAGQYL